MRIKHLTQLLVLPLATGLIGIAPSLAQSNAPEGKLHITVSPKQAYVFVDGKAIRDGNQTMNLTAGDHQVDVANYGYAMKEQNIQVTAGHTTDLDVALQKSGDEVTGPFGDIEFKGHPRAAVLLNGSTPGYFVGHVDEFDNNWIWHQWLLVKAGTYQATVTQNGQTIWSGPVSVKSGQRVVVYLDHNGETKTKDFKAGLKLGPEPRFETGVASAVVPIAPVSAQLSASQTQTSCGQSAMLNWKATDAVDTSIGNLGKVSETGDRSVTPTSTTSYELVAKGPGGEATRTVTIDVNNEPTATLALSQPDVTYHKIGDKVVEQGSTTVNWLASNASRVSIDPFGRVSDNGSRTIDVQPSQTGSGPVNQDVTYTLNVANACGGTVTRTATLHISGSIDPAPPVTLASVFYPTNYPDSRHPKVGLVSNEKQELAKAAVTFKNHEQYAQPNELLVVGYADARGPDKYNLTLSQRRAELVKDYLVSQGIAADDIKIQADGKDHQLDERAVQDLQARDPQSPPAWMTKRQKATWLAYNRRVDIILQPAGQESAKVYPNDAPDARLLWERPQPSLKSIQTAETASAQNTGAEPTQASIAPAN